MMIYEYGDVAQSVERWIEDPRVIGSIPVFSTETRVSDTTASMVLWDTDRRKTFQDTMTYLDPLFKSLLFFIL